ncbi:MAG: YfgM family protein [Methylotenera sp.]|jgi:predicted negative regulator of RcsB-dependent stress response
MALDLEDQEQLDEFKVWWNKYGKLTINIVLALLLVYVAWQGYQYMQHQKAVEASDLYQKLVQLDSKKADLVKSEGAKLMNDYTSTPYAGRAAVLLAKTSFQSDDIKSAKSQLEWAIANAQEDAVKAIARLELSTILLSEKDYEGAERLLTGDIDPGYIGLKDSLVGDVYIAQGKSAEAKQAYENALEKLDRDGRLYSLTQQKLDALGS